MNPEASGIPTPNPNREVVTGGVRSALPEDWVGYGTGGNYWQRWDPSGTWRFKVWRNGPFWYWSWDGPSFVSYDRQDYTGPRPHREPEEGIRSARSALGDLLAYYGWLQNGGEDAA
jgi:hypothetical protein